MSLLILNGRGCSRVLPGVQVLFLKGFLVLMKQGTPFGTMFSLDYIERRYSDICIVDRDTTIGKCPLFVRVDNQWVNREFYL